MCPSSESKREEKWMKEKKERTTLCGREGNKQRWRMKTIKCVHTHKKRKKPCTHTHTRTHSCKRKLQRTPESSFLPYLKYWITTIWYSFAAYYCGRKKEGRRGRERKKGEEKWRETKRQKREREKGTKGNEEQEWRGTGKEWLGQHAEWKEKQC